MICAYALIENGAVIQYPIYEGDLKLMAGYDDFCGMPFVPPDGYVGVEDVIPPNVQLDYTQTLKEKTPELIDGVWTRVWSIEDATEEELQFRIERKSKEVRKIRNQLLSETDWTQFPDSPANSSDWIEYRQALRDISKQEGFPWHVEWPSNGNS